MSGPQPYNLAALRNSGALDELYKRGYLAPTIYRDLDVKNKIEIMRAQGLNITRAVKATAPFFRISISQVWRILAKLSK